MGIGQIAIGQYLCTEFSQINLIIDTSIYFSSPGSMKLMKCPNNYVPGTLKKARPNYWPPNV